MSPDRPLQIPDVHLQAFTLLESMDESHYTSLAAALASVEFPARYSDVVSLAEQSRALPPDRAGTVIDALVSLCNVSTQSAEESASTAERIANADQVTDDPDRKTAFAERLSRLLDNRSIRLLSKSILIGGQYPQVFAGAQILTDVRPMFDTDIETTSGPEGALLVHSLLVRYVGSNGERDDFYVALDDMDLEKLLEVVQRARAKSAALQRSLSRFGVPQIVTE